LIRASNNYLLPERLLGCAGEHKLPDEWCVFHVGAAGGCEAVWQTNRCRSLALLGSSYRKNQEEWIVAYR
jgi:hypothetical protein